MSSAVRNHHLPALRRSGAPAFQSFPREKSQSNGGRRCPMISRSQHPVLPPFSRLLGMSLLYGNWTPVSNENPINFGRFPASERRHGEAVSTANSFSRPIAPLCALLRQFCGKPQSGTVSPCKKREISSKKASPYRSSLTCPTPVISRSASLSRGSRRHISRSVTSAKTM